MFMWMKLVVICLLFESIDSFAEEVRRYKYVGWYVNDFKSIIEPSYADEIGRFVIGDDALHEARFCTDQDDYVCIFSQAYAFSFPRTTKDVQVTWELDGVTYRLVRQGITLSLWGREVTDIYLVETPREA